MLKHTHEDTHKGSKLEQYFQSWKGGADSRGVNECKECIFQ